MGHSALPDHASMMEGSYSQSQKQAHLLALHHADPHDTSNNLHPGPGTSLMTNHLQGDTQVAHHSAWRHLLYDCVDDDATYVYDVTSGTPFLSSPLKIIVRTVIGRSAKRTHKTRGWNTQVVLVTLNRILDI
jgi:hypothetical protein